MTHATAQPFIGAKMLLHLGPDLLVIRRDEKPGLPWPGYLDLPGGGREGDETPEACVLRETREETGLILTAADLTWRAERQGEAGQSWFFAAHLNRRAIRSIVFGDEGQSWSLIAPSHYLRAPDAIPHFAAMLARYLDATPLRT